MCGKCLGGGLLKLDVTDVNLDVSKNSVFFPPNHPFVHRVGTIIFTIHFGRFTPIFGNTQLVDGNSSLLTQMSRVFFVWHSTVECFFLLPFLYREINLNVCCMPICHSISISIYIYISICHVCL